ncbi:UNVERIFIED_CONTAM: hypothetical protein FKN15_055407 [Acipenser sinensis]
MAQVLELLSRQQAPAAPTEVPASYHPHQLQSLALPWQPFIAEEDTLSIEASWGEGSFSTEMEEGEEPAPTTAVEPSLEVASGTSLPQLCQLQVGINGAHCKVATPAEPRLSVFRTQAAAPTMQPFPPFPDMEEVGYLLFKRMNTQLTAEHGSVAYIDHLTEMLPSLDPKSDALKQI